MTLSIRPGGSTRAVSLSAPYIERLQTLSEGSVLRNFDPYLDIDWDSDDFVVDPHDPRWELSASVDPLGAHPWYRAQPLERRIEIGLAYRANQVRVGLLFESILIRGLVQTAMRMPHGSPEFRYAMHEIAEECNHIQMFQELVNRIGLDVPGMRWFYGKTSPIWHLIVAPMPTIFMFGILAGEEPIDHIQKSALREGAEAPPVLLRTMEIHIAEEARHISFAHEFLRERVPAKSGLEKLALSMVVPLIMRFLAGAIVVPPARLRSELGIPRKVFREAFWSNPVSRKILSGYFTDVRMLVKDLGLMGPAARVMWKLAGIDGDSARFRSEPDRRAG